jgi:hypothetical protein
MAKRKRTVVYQYGSSHISGGSKDRSTGSDVTESDVTGSDCVRMHNQFPRFFL